MKRITPENNAGFIAGPRRKLGVWLGLFYVDGMIKR